MYVQCEESTLTLPSRHQRDKYIAMYGTTRLLSVLQRLSCYRSMTLYVTVDVIEYLRNGKSTSPSMSSSAAEALPAMVGLSLINTNNVTQATFATEYYKYYS